MPDQKKNSPEFVLRSVGSISMPPFAVVKCRGSFGDDVAWFFSKQDALEYITWKQPGQDKDSEHHCSRCGERSSVLVSGFWVSGNAVPARVCKSCSKQRKFVPNKQAEP